MSKLLVVDDEPRTAELTAELFRRAGYLVDVAVSGTEALERVRASSPDLMLLDYEMPDMEAPEVLDQLRSGGEGIDFPVIILTGARHAAADQVIGLDRGATDYIVKGTDRQVLLARVRGALRTRETTSRSVVRGRLRIDASRGEASLGGRALQAPPDVASAGEPRRSGCDAKRAAREGVGQQLCRVRAQRGAGGP